MRMTSLLLAFTASVLAEDSTTTVPYLFPLGFTDIEIPRYESTAASVKGINALETTYEVRCQDNAPTSDCKIDTPWTVIAGENTYSLTGVYTGWITDDSAVTATRDIACTFSSNTETASCSVSYKATGTWDGAEYGTSTEASSSDIPTNSITVYGMKVTGGVDKFDSPQATETPDAAGGLNVRGPMVTAAPLGAAAAVAVAALF